VAEGTLVFRQPASGSARLVFGAANAGSGPVVPQQALHVEARVSGEGAAQVWMRTVLAVGCNATVAGEGAARAETKLLWSANVSRPDVRLALHSRWQEAMPGSSGIATHWQETQRLHTGAGVRW